MEQFNTTDFLYKLIREKKTALIRYFDINAKVKCGMKKIAQPLS